MEKNLEMPSNLAIIRPKGVGAVYKLEIIYPANKERTKFHLDRSEMRFSYETRPNKSDEDTMEDIYLAWQPPLSSKFGAPPLGVGDVIKIKDNPIRYYICDAVGFTLVPSDYAEKWIAEMTEGEIRGRGLAECINRGLFPAIPKESAT